MATQETPKNPADPFAQLTWDDLSHWAGSTIVDRGRSYQQGRSVKDLALTPKGSLIAWVDGTERYATTVTMQDKRLVSSCTCPYGATCKHAVAVVLEYLACLKVSRSVPPTTPEDRRLRLLGAREKGNEPEEDLPPQRAAQKRPEPSPQRATRKRSESSLRRYLEGQTKEQLVDLIERAADLYPEVKQMIEDHQSLQTGNVKKMIQAARSEIAEINALEWGEEYDETTPDYDRLKTHLRALLEAGHADEVLRLGKELMEAGNRAIETHDDGGEVSDEISGCMEVVFQALAQCTLSPAKQLRWAVDVELADEYDVCEVGLKAFWEGRRTQADWDELAGELRRRLEEDQPVRGEDSFSRNYRRDHLSDWLITALQGAGRGDEVIALCEREAELTGSYMRLVERLIQDRRWEEAERWCRRGIEATKAGGPGIGDALRRKLCTISEQAGDPLRAAAFYAEELLSHPGVQTFQALCQAAEKAGVRPAVEVWARHHLETGQIPPPASAPSAKRPGAPDCPWPLPDPGLARQARPRPSEGPMISVLIDLAIAEGKPDEVLKWYDHPHSQNRREVPWGRPHQQVAEAVEKAHPDRAIAIWKRLAEEQIARTEVKAYPIAGGYLRRVKEMLLRTERQAEWQAYLSALREQNRRKPRCVAVLDALAGKPIVEG